VNEAAVMRDKGTVLASEVREMFTLYRWVAARPILTWNLIVAVAILVSQ
jgi:hypothetical protein